MIVDSVSPTPFALLRRAKHFQYRDEDELLQQFSHFRDPVEALTDECKRVLYCIATTNSSIARSRHGGMTTTLNNLNNGPDESWSRFQDLGFSDSTIGVGSPGSSSTTSQRQALRSAPRSRPTDLGRPTTPSWADFLSSGFADENVEGPSNPALLLPPDKILPPIGGDGFNRAKSPGLGEDEDGLEPGELASITQFELDDTFWWVWMTSLAAEEPTERKAVFGRCALIETDIYGGRWLLMEEQVKGASPGPEEGAYIAEKKSLFTLKRKNKDRRKSTMQAKSPEPMEPVSRGVSATPSKSSMSLDQQAKIKAAAAALAQKQKQQDPDQIAQRRGRIEDAASTKTNSIFTLGLTSEASPAMKWANAYDKEEIRRQYLGDNFAGKGLGMDSEPSSVSAEARYTDPAVSAAPMQSASQDKPERELPTVSKDEKIEALPEATPSPPPAPLPKEPIVTVTPVDDGASVAASEAASVPLPEMTPHEEKAMEALEKAMEAHAALSPKVTQVERKPVPRSNDISNHPAFRNRVEQQNAGKAGGSPATEAARRAWEARDAASAHPEAKKTGQAGIRKFFAKKRDNSDRQSLTKPAPQGLQPPSEASVGRHLSLLRKKTPTQVPTQNRAAPVSAAALAAAPAAAPAPVTSLAEQEAPSSNGQHNDSEVGTMSRVDSEEHHDAAHAFSRFDQGPLDGVPAFVPGGPRESYDDGAPSISTQNDHEPDYFHQQTSNEPQRSEYATPVGDLNSSSARHGGTWLNYRPEGTAEPSSDAASEVSMDYPSEPVAPTVNDRWAQIRKNAAERAARMSEEQSGRSQTTRTEDDGETSGEESEYPPDPFICKIETNALQQSRRVLLASKPVSPNSRATSDSIASSATVDERMTHVIDTFGFCCSDGSFLFFYTPQSVSSFVSYILSFNPTCCHVLAIVAFLIPCFRCFFSCRTLEGLVRAWTALERL